MNYPYVGFFRRAVAFLLDILLVGLLPTLLCAPLFSSQNALLLQLPASPLKDEAITSLIVGCSLLWQVLFLIIYWLYFAFCESSRKQATLGKRLLGIKVIDQRGRRIRFGRATARTVVRFFMQFTAYIGFVMAGCTRRKRGLHDMIVQTYVVRKDFKPTDELPDTPGHPVWLVLWSVLLVSFALLSVIANSIPDMDEQEIMPEAAVASAQTSVPPEQALAPDFPTQPDRFVAQAQTRLQELARTQAAVPSGAEQDGTRYFRHADGYRALLANSMTLFIPNGQTEVCCEEDNNNSCQQAGLTVCNK